VYVGRMSLKNRTMSRSTELRAEGLLIWIRPTFPERDGIALTVNLIELMCGSSK